MSEDEDTWDFDDYYILALHIPCDLEGGTSFSGFNSRKGTSITHERTWKDLEGSRPEGKHSWNYYPRGRVEISGGKARIFLNPVIFNCKLFKESLIKEFNLQRLPVKIIADNSFHYNSHSENINI